MALVKAALDGHPRYGHPVARSQFLGHPIWLVALFLALATLVRFAAVARGGPDALASWVGDLFSEPLPSGRPPWQVWFVDDATSDVVALVAKVHHALLDGAAGVRLLERLLAPAAPGS